MRGKGQQAIHRVHGSRITPAHAGKSKSKALSMMDTWDHPRTCGEKPDLRYFFPGQIGSPPHMRGKAVQRPEPESAAGITPAHAGKSLVVVCGDAGRWDHPRTCGEKATRHGYSSTGLGSPPHMRGKGTEKVIIIEITGITPAHAGKRLVEKIVKNLLKDHPRTCGEKYP